jgi:hypothetical protein
VRIGRTGALATDTRLPTAVAVLEARRRLVHDPIAYTYDGYYHCPGCAEERFGLDEYGEVSGVDSQGIAVGAVAPWDDWHSHFSEYETLTCASCGSDIADWAADDIGDEIDSSVGEALRRAWANLVDEFREARMLDLIEREIRRQRRAFEEGATEVPPEQ